MQCFGVCGELIFERIRQCLQTLVTRGSRQRGAGCEHCGTGQQPDDRSPGAFGDDGFEYIASLAADCTVGVADDPIGLTPIVVGIEAQQNRIVRGHSANRLASTRAWDGPDRFSSSSRLYKE